ncbi:hypothetical protein ACP4OV_011968 [Aristida adscensionis]
MIPPHHTFPSANSNPCFFSSLPPPILRHCPLPIAALAGGETTQAKASSSMDPCPFVRVLVGNLALKLPAAPRAAAPAGAGVHPATATATCYCRIRLNKLPYQTATAPLLADQGPAAACTGAFAAAFHLSKPDLDRATAKPALFGPRRAARLKVAVYAGRRGTSCGVATSGRLLGKVVIPLDLKDAAGKPVVFHSGWVPIGKRRKAPAAAAAQGQLNLTVRAEPDPRFVFEFDGEPECSPQVVQVQGSMRQPMFTCTFSCRSASDLRSRSLPSAARTWLTRFGSDRERKGWSVTVHDLSGSPVALASMVTPFVASPGSDRVSRSNPGAWLILRPGEGTWKPWGRLECWRERGGGGGDCLGYRFELVVAEASGMGVCVAEAGIPAARGGRFGIDLTAAQGFGRSGSAGSSPRGSGELGHWPFGTFRGFVTSAAVQGEGRPSRPRVEVGVAHVACAEDAAAFVALAAAVDLSMDACRLFSCRLRRELSSSASRGDLLFAR